MTRNRIVTYTCDGCGITSPETFPGLPIGWFEIDPPGQASADVVHACSRECVYTVFTKGADLYLKGGLS